MSRVDPFCPDPSGSGARHYTRADAPITNPPLTRDNFGETRAGCCGCLAFDFRLDTATTTDADGSITVYIFVDEFLPRTGNAVVQAYITSAYAGSSGTGDVVGNTIINFSGSAEVGLMVSSGGILAPNTLITAINGSTLTLSQAATSDAEGAALYLSLPPGCPVQVVVIFESVAGNTVAPFQITLATGWLDASLLTTAPLTLSGSGNNLAFMATWSLEATVTIT